MSAAFSAIMTVGAAVLPLVINGMTEASATRSPSIPRTLRAASTTAPSSAPMRQVPTGCQTVVILARTQASISSSDRIASPGGDFVVAIGIERRLPHDLARKPDPVAHHKAVGFRGERVGVNLRRGAGIGGGDTDLAAALGAELIAMGEEAVAALFLARHVESEAGQEGELNIWVVENIAGAGEAAGFERDRGAGAGAEEIGAKAGERRAVGTHQTVKRDRPGAGILDVDPRMVLQVAPHIRAFGDDGDAERAEMVRRADP